MAVGVALEIDGADFVCIYEIIHAKLTAGGAGGGVVDDDLFAGRQFDPGDASLIGIDLVNIKTGGRVADAFKGALVAALDEVLSAIIEGEEVLLRLENLNANTPSVEGTGGAGTEAEAGERATDQLLPVPAEVPK